MTEVEYTTVTFRCAMDNHEPYPRKEATGTLCRFVHPVTGNEGVEIRGEDRAHFPDKCILIIDDGTNATPYYRSGRVTDRQADLFYRFPANPNHGLHGWHHGPMKAFHLLIKGS